MRSSVKVVAMSAAAPSLVIALPLLLTACSAASSSPTAGSTASSSTLPASTPASASPVTPGGSSLSADQIASKANADLKAATSYHLSGTLDISGTTETMKLTHAAGNCAGTISIGNQPISFVQVGSTAWVRAGSGGDYLKTSTSNSSYKQDFSYCDPSQVAELVGPMSGSLTKGATTTVDGTQVQKLALANVITIYVTTSATPEYERVTDNVDSEHVQLDFSSINAPVSINPPPASEVLGT
ncbi:MAG: hypothetical protein JO345_21035 [Streptosporangiaceae bacterium]|nr:hypothetical protein [Streptosporangiaceae bacterium]